MTEKAFQYFNSLLHCHRTTSKKENEKMTKYGYARISTDDQRLDRQLIALKEYGVDEIVSDIYTGSKMDRPNFQIMLNSLKEGDQIIVTDLTRFSRSTRELFILVDLLKDKGATIKSFKDTWLDISSENPYANFLLTVMSAVAQLERDLIRMRTMEGVRIAHAKGKFKGRAKIFTENNPRLKHALDMYQAGGTTVKEVCQKTGISESTFYRIWKSKKDQLGI
jgi:DNA invertase Pin-like site-specific DNA recombinase